MFCPKCGKQCPDNAGFCNNCGTVLSFEQPSQPYSSAYAPVSSRASAIQLNTKRSLLKFFFLGIVTLGIYPIVFYCGISDDINIIASRYDGKKTMNFMAMSALAPFTLFIYMFVWIHKLCNRIGNEARRRGIDYNFGAKHYWLWAVLGSLILVGPFIYIHKLAKCSNLIAEDYNARG